MIRYSDSLTLPISIDELRNYVERATTEPYIKNSINTYELEGISNFRLMEKTTLELHCDGENAYRVLLMLKNKNGNYTIRGDGQEVLEQPAGTLLILDIGAMHQVTSKTGDGRLGTWSALCWEPMCRPFPKSMWTPSSLLVAATQEINLLCEVLQYQNQM